MQKLKLNTALKSEIVKFLAIFLPFSFCLLNFSGCAVKAGLPLGLNITPKISGITHTVKKGETLWRISQTYNVSLETVVAANNLSDKSRIASGQTLVIPGIKTKKNIPQPSLINKTQPQDNFGYIWPVKGEIISYFHDTSEHLINKGITIQIPLGTNILCSRSGTVIFCADKIQGYGKIVIVGHEGGFSTVYAHNLENLVKINDKVSQGMIIAKTGTDAKTRKPALLFQLRKGIIPQNPLYYLP